MSKTTRALVILGVVAGLGVAALPLSSYAAPVTITHGDESLTEDTDYGTTGGNNKWVKDDATIQLVIEDELSITLDSSDETNPTLVTLTGDITNGFKTTNPLKVTVVSNNSNGYNLNLKGSTAGTATSLINATGEEIVKADGTFAAPAALDATSNSVWGYAIADNNAFDGDKYAGVTAEGETIKQVLKTDTAALATLSDTGDITNINFAAAIKRGQAAGTYTGQVTLTATNNAAATNN